MRSDGPEDVVTGIPHCTDHWFWIVPKRHDFAHPESELPDVSPTGKAFVQGKVGSIRIGADGEVAGADARKQMGTNCIS